MPTAATTRKKTARKPAKRTPRTVDLHDPSIDPTGRVDVLVARGLKLLVERMGNPAIQTLYTAFQADIDKVVAKELRAYNMGELMGGGLQGPDVEKGRRTRL